MEVSGGQRRQHAHGHAQLAHLAGQLAGRRSYAAKEFSDGTRDREPAHLTAHFLALRKVLERGDEHDHDIRDDGFQTGVVEPVLAEQSRPLVGGQDDGRASFGDADKLVAHSLDVAFARFLALAQHLLKLRVALGPVRRLCEEANDLAAGHLLHELRSTRGHARGPLLAQLHDHHITSVGECEEGLLIPRGPSLLLERLGVAAEGGCRELRAVLVRAGEIQRYFADLRSDAGSTIAKLF